MTLRGSPFDEGPVFDVPRPLDGPKTAVLQRGPGPASRSLLAGRPVLPAGPGAGEPRCFARDGRRLFQVVARRAGTRWRGPVTARLAPDAPVGYTTRDPSRAPPRLPYFPRTLAPTPNFTRLEPGSTKNFLDLRPAPGCDSLAPRLRPWGTGEPRERPQPLLCLIPDREERRCRRVLAGPLPGRSAAAFQDPAIPLAPPPVVLPAPTAITPAPLPGKAGASEEEEGPWNLRPPLPCQIDGRPVIVLSVAAGAVRPHDLAPALARPAVWARQDRPPGTDLRHALVPGWPRAWPLTATDLTPRTPPPGHAWTPLPEPWDRGMSPRLSPPSACPSPRREPLANRPPASPWPLPRRSAPVAAERWALSLAALQVSGTARHLATGGLRAEPARPHWPAFLPTAPDDRPPERSLGITDRIEGSPVNWLPGVIPARFAARFPPAAWRVLRTIRLSRQALHNRTGRQDRPLALNLLVPEPGAVRRCRDHPPAIVSHAPGVIPGARTRLVSPHAFGSPERAPGGDHGLWARPPRPLAGDITARRGWPGDRLRPSVAAGWALRPRRLVFLPLPGTAWPGTREPPPRPLPLDPRPAPAPSGWRVWLEPHPGPIPREFAARAGPFRDAIELVLRSVPFSLLALLEPFNDIHDPPSPRRQALKNPRYLQSPGFTLPRRREGLRLYHLSFPTPVPRFLLPARGQRIRLAVRRRAWPTRFAPGRSVCPAAAWRADGPQSRPFSRTFLGSIASVLEWRPGASPFHLLDQRCGEPASTPKAEALSSPTSWLVGRGPRHLWLHPPLLAPTRQVAEPPFLAPPPWPRDRRPLTAAIGLGPFPFGFPPVLERPGRLWLLHAPPDLPLLHRGGLVDWPGPYLLTRYLRIRGATNLRAPRRFLVPDLRVGTHFPFGMAFGPAADHPFQLLLPNRPVFPLALASGTLPPLRHWREPSTRLPRPIKHCRLARHPPFRPGTVPFHHPTAPLPEPGAGPPNRGWPPSESVRGTMGWLRALLPYPRLDLPPDPPHHDRPPGDDPRPCPESRPPTVGELPPRPAPASLILSFQRLTSRFPAGAPRPMDMVFPTGFPTTTAPFRSEVPLPSLPRLAWLQIEGEATMGTGVDEDDIRVLQIRFSPTIPVLPIDFPNFGRPLSAWGPVHSLPGDGQPAATGPCFPLADRLLPDPEGFGRGGREAPMPWSRLLPTRLPGLPHPTVSPYRRPLLRLAGRFPHAFGTHGGTAVALPPLASWMTEVRLPPMLHAPAPHWTMSPGLLASLQIVPDRWDGVSVLISGSHRPIPTSRLASRAPLEPVPSKRHQGSRLPVLFRTKRPVLTVLPGQPAFPAPSLRWSPWSFACRDLRADPAFPPLPTPPFVRPGWSFLLFLAPATPLPVLGSEVSPLPFPALPFDSRRFARKTTVSPRTFRLHAWPNPALVLRPPHLPDWVDLPGHAPGDQMRLRFPIHL